MRPHNPITLFRAFLGKREPAVLITAFNKEDRKKTQYGTCMLIERNSQIMGELADGLLANEVIRDAGRVFDEGSADHKNYLYQNGYTCFIELLEPSVSLVIAGAGNDAIPLVQMGKMLGWSVTLIDGRANYNTQERLPLADKRLVARPEEVLSKLSIDHRTVFMLMTHNYNYDLAMLKELFSQKMLYIGVLGPKKRLERLLQELHGDERSPDCPENLHGPAGLDLGADNPDEIALSIVAEIQMVIKQRDGSPLKHKSVVHKRDNFVRKLQKEWS